MPQSTRFHQSSNEQRPSRRGSSRKPVNQLAIAGRAWTITSSEQQDIPVPSQAPPQPARQAVPQHARSSHQARRSNGSAGVNPPVRIRSPPPGFRGPADRSQTFKEWLQTDPTGPHLSQEEATRTIQQLTYDELLQDERTSACKRSVAAQSQAANSESRRKASSEKPDAAKAQTVYSESVYSSNAPPSAYGAGCVPLRYSSTSARTSEWVDDMRKSAASNNPNSRSTQNRKGKDEHSRR